MAPTIQNSAPYDGRSVANLILDLADSKNIPMTQMKLLKLLYFCHGWYLASENKKLIKQDFQAWEYGPVVRVVRDSFKQFGKNNIDDRAKRLDIFSGEWVPVPEIKNNYDIEFITRVFESYQSYDAWKLSDITHEKGSPWDIVWNSSKPIGKLSLRLNEEDIRVHFERLPNRFIMN